MTIDEKDIRAERVFKRAKEIVAAAEVRQEQENGTYLETIQHLAFRIAELEGAGYKDEYNQEGPGHGKS